jgi:hypothetical protein
MGVSRLAWMMVRYDTNVMCVVHCALSGLSSLDHRLVLSRHHFLFILEVLGASLILQF